jgi:hypothetical protein
VAFLFGYRRLVPGQFAFRFRASCLLHFSPHCVGDADACQRTAMRAIPRATPGALAPVRVLVSRSIHAYSAPSAPLTGTSRFRCLAPYTLCLRCAFPPRRPISGSVLSLFILSRHVILYDSGKFGGCLYPVPSPPTLAFVPFRRTRHFQGFPQIRFMRGTLFEALRFAYATTCRVARPPDGSDRTCAQPTGTFTSGLPTAWSPAPSPDITTVTTG